MQITIEPNKLSAEQLAAVINFLSTYPKHATTTHRERFELEVSANTDNAIKEINKVKEAARGFESPETAFGKTVDVLNSGSFHMKPEDAKAASDAGANVTQNSNGTYSTNPSVATDRNGLPWDVRIHSSNKQTTADGIWRKRRGIDDATVASVEAELRQVMGAPAAATVLPQSIVNAPPPPPAVAVDPNAMPPIPAALVRAPAPPPADARSAYVALIGRTSAALHQGKIKQEQVTQCCATFGVPALPLLANRLDLVPQVAAAIDALIAGASL